MAGKNCLPEPVSLKIGGKPGTFSLFPEKGKWPREIFNLSTGTSWTFYVAQL